MATQKLRRTRIVCISDTHNCTVKLPAGDVLIHAGDLTNQGSYSELSRTIKWLEEADFEAKIVVAGNHDITLDADFYFHHGSSFHNTVNQDPDACLSLLTSSSSITYLCHDSATIRLKSPTGPHTEFKVFGSPYSPRHGLWAFYYDAPQAPDDERELTSLWELIPLEADIVITHTPPRNHRDRVNDEIAVGCEALRQALWRVRPKLVVCGHVHDGRGAERVLWDLKCRAKPFAEKSVTRWEDPGMEGNKISLLDLTGKKQLAMLDNDGSHPTRLPHALHDDRGNSPSHPTPGLTKNASSASLHQLHHHHNGNGHHHHHHHHHHPSPSLEAQLQIPFADGDTPGLGGNPETDECDRDALLGRMGRRETCIVNAAVVKSKYPHQGGKEFNKPIVVDVYLPVWEE